MKEFNNYILHKIALITYNMYEDKVRELKSKGMPIRYYNLYDFTRSISIHFKNVKNAVIYDEEELNFVNDVIAKMITDIDEIYGIKDSEIGVEVFDFFTKGEWGYWIKIVSDTKRYFGV